MTNNERKELYRDRFCDMGGTIRWVFFDDHNGEGDYVTVYCNYFDADLFEAATKAMPTDPLAWILSECKQCGMDYFFSNPTEEEAAYDEALAEMLSYDEDAGLFAMDCTAETINLIARQFGGRICSACGAMHYEGYYFEDAFVYYCSDECLHSVHTAEEYDEMYEEGYAYWTQWWE